MSVYKEMYDALFKAIIKAINDLQESQQQTEEMYITSDEPKLLIVDNKGSIAKDTNN